MLRVENMVKLLNSHFSKITLQDEGIYLLMYLKKMFWGPYEERLSVIHSFFPIGIYKELKTLS